MSTEPSDISPDSKRVIAAVEALSEHFDCVHIFASRHESGEHDGTFHWSKGSGNWMARYGQIRCWLIAEDEKTRGDMRKECE